MAADFIAVDKTKTEGARIVALANALLSLIQNAQALSDNKDHMVDAGPDYTMFIARTGVSSANAGNLATLIGYAQEILCTNATVAGADRLSRLKEICTRISGQ